MHRIHKKRLQYSFNDRSKSKRGRKNKFFNRPALTTTLPAQLALKFELPIIPVFIERTNEKIFA